MMRSGICKQGFVCYGCDCGFDVHVRSRQCSTAVKSGEQYLVCKHAELPCQKKSDDSHVMSEEEELSTTVTMGDFSSRVVTIAWIMFQSQDVLPWTECANSLQ